MTRDIKIGQTLFLVAAGLTLVGVVLAAAQPLWLMRLLETSLQNAAGAAPLVYVLLCMVAAPLHLSGVVIELAPVTWSPGVVWSLSFTGTLLGGLITALILVRLGGSMAAYRASWPGWLQRLAAWVRRYPFQVGLAARLTLGSGAILEAFFVLTGYTRRQYFISAVLGTALWISQALFGEQLLGWLFETSPALVVLIATLPFLSFLGQVLLRRVRL